MPQPVVAPDRGSPAEQSQERLARHPPRPRHRRSPASPAPASPRWPSTRSSRRASGATSSRSPPTRACSSSASTGPTWTASSTSGPPSRSSRRTRCAPRAPRWAPPPRCYDYLRLLYAKIGRVHCPTCGAEARSDSADQVADALAARPPGRARADLLPARRRRRAASRARCAPPSLRRGFARVKVGGRRPATWPRRRAPPTRCPPTWTPDRLPSCSIAWCSARDAARRLTESLETALARGRRPGRAWICSTRGVVPVSREFRCPRLRGGADAAAAAALLVQPSARRLPRVQGLRQRPALRRGPRGARSDAEPRRRRGRAVDASLGPLVPEQLLKAAKKRGVDVSRPYAELSAEERDMGLRRRRRASPASSGFFEEVESYRYKLHVRVFLSRYRSQSPLPALRGRAAQARGARRPRGRRHHRRARRPDHRGPAALLDDAAAHRAGRRRSPARSCASSGPSSPSCCAWASATSRSARQTRTLSGGEAQRINLANQLGSQLVGTLYVLDEPSIGLHARDTTRLAELCRELAAGRQHGRRRRARPLRSSRRPTTCRAGAGLGRARRRDRLRGHPGRVRAGSALAHRALPDRPRDDPPAAHAPRGPPRPRRSRARARTT